MEDVSTIKSSEDIVADLLNDVKSSDKPFSVDKLAGMVESETNKSEKKHKKHKKHKKSKKKKSSSKHRSRSRSRSPSRKHKKRKRRHSSSSCSSENIKNEKIPTDPSVKKETVPLTEPQPSHSNQDSTCVEDFKPFIPKVEDDFESKLLVKKEIKLSININTVNQNVVKTEEKDEKEEGELVDTTDMDISSKKAKRRHRSTSRNTDEVIKKNVDRKRSRSRDKKDRHRKSSRSPPRKVRGREENRHNNDKKRVDERSTRRTSRSISRNRRRTYSRDKERRNRSRDERFDRRRRSRTPIRRRSRSREYIDKEKLLEIAKKNRARMYATGEQRSNATVEDFVTYCQRLQKRQEKEKRREKGEAVSSDDDSEPDVQYKHPYALPSNNPIRINIVTSATATLAQKALTAPEEKELGVSELRVLFPVSSGAVHKENAEWTPVVKADVPKSCTNEQKKHVALTSFEIERCKLQGIPVPQPQSAPTFLHSILPPPPPPPQFIPNPSSPPPLPQVLYLPPKDKLIIKEPTGQMPAPKDLSETLKLRVDAQRRLATNPNDFDAHRNLREANERMEAWAALKSLPGEYTGTTGLKLLTPEELQPMNPKYHAWVKRDQFKKAAPQLGGVGQRLMEKMGWKPGEGLGKEADGNLEPLTLDVKSDRKGLMAEQEMSIKQRNKLNGVTPSVVDLSNKNPISLLMELCAKRRWPVPQFTCEEIGKDAQKQFIWTVAVNNALYRPIGGSKSKKEGKTVVAQVALQSMGVLPRDPNLPVFM